MTIKDAIFAVESYAHLNGKERELLTVVESARKEHEALLACVEELRHQKDHCYNPFEPDNQCANYHRICATLTRLEKADVQT